MFPAPSLNRAHRPRLITLAIALVTALALVACDPDPATTEPGAAPPPTTDPATPAAPAAPADPTAP